MGETGLGVIVGRADGVTVILEDGNYTTLEQRLGVYQAILPSMSTSLHHIEQHELDKLRENASELQLRFADTE